MRRALRSTLFPYTTLFRSNVARFRFDERARRVRRHELAVGDDEKLLASSWRRTRRARSEEHTSELQSLRHLVCRLLLEKKKKKKQNTKLNKRKTTASNKQR